MIKIAYDPIYCHHLPPNHRFPMEKYELIPQQLIYEGSYESANFFSPEPMDESLILEVHDINYLNALKRGQVTRKSEKRIGFPFSQELLKREYKITFGTIQAALYALENQFAFNVAGGTHHAYADRGEGFCIFNDIAVASTYLLNHRKIKQILVVDLDVHQGNGTAKIFENETRVFTFSMHGKRNYPSPKEKSDLDIELETGTGDDVYLSILRENLPKLIQSIKPEFIFFQSGVDVLETDKLGKLSLSINGCRERDFMVLNLALKNDIPLVAVMGGGYSPQLKDIVEAHCNTYRIAAEV